jgi:hypothetical protein
MAIYKDEKKQRFSDIPQTITAAQVRLSSAPQPQSIPFARQLPSPPATLKAQAAPTGVPTAGQAVSNFFRRIGPGELRRGAAATDVAQSQPALPRASAQSAPAVAAPTLSAPAGAAPVRVQPAALEPSAVAQTINGIFKSGNRYSDQGAPGAAPFKPRQPAQVTVAPAPGELGANTAPNATAIRAALGTAAGGGGVSVIGGAAEDNARISKFLQQRAVDHAQGRARFLEASDREDQRLARNAAVADAQGKLKQATPGSKSARELQATISGLLSQGNAPATAETTASQIAADASRAEADAAGSALTAAKTQGQDLANQQQQSIANLFSRITDPNASEDQSASAAQVLARLTGKQQAAFKPMALGGGQDEMNRPLPQQLAIINQRDGSYQIVGQGGTGASAANGPSANHINALRNNPSLAAQFDEMYGDGAAAQALGT